jgi:hypothetical protein
MFKEKIERALDTIVAEAINYEVTTATKITELCTEILTLIKGKTDDNDSGTA